MLFIVITQVNKFYDSLYLPATIRFASVVCKSSVSRTYQVYYHIHVLYAVNQFMLSHIIRVI